MKRRWSLCVRWILFVLMPGRLAFSQEAASTADDRSQKKAVVEVAAREEPTPIGQDPSPQEEPAVFELKPVLVSPLREFHSTLEIPSSSTKVDREEMSREAPENLPDALSEQPGLQMQKSNQGGGSPVVRGRTGKDVLLLIDGQRFSNSTFRRNHQYLNTVDLFAVETAEIVRGPASVRYGSDAIGGAVNLLTRRAPVLDEFGFGGSTHLSYQTSNRSLTTHVDLHAGANDFGFEAGYTTRTFDDLEAGRVGDPIEAVDIDGRQDPTAYRERDFYFSAVRRLNEHSTLDYFLLYDRQYHVPTSERLIANEKEPAPPDLFREVDPQRLHWQMLRLRHHREGNRLESVEVKISLNNPAEGRTRVSASAPTEVIEENDDLLAPGISAHVGLRTSATHVLTVGGEGYYETLDSERRVLDTSTGGVTLSENGRYPDDSRYRSFGVFAQDQWQLKDDLQWINGLRYSRVRVSADFDGLTVGTLPPFEELAETYDDVTLATGLLRRVGEYSSVYASVGRGFRAPNLDDLAVLGDFSAGNRVPNFDLEQETVWSFEIGWKRESPTTSAGVVLAHARYHDLLANQFLFTQGGTDFFQVENSSRAYTYTFEGWLDHLLHQSQQGPGHWLFSQADWTLGRDESADEPLSKVPPLQVLLGYRVDGLPRDLFGEIYARGAARQDRVSSADEADPRFPIDGTPAWWTLNLRAGIDLAPGARLSAALENLFNVRYRIHGSGIDAPGRNFVIGLQWSF